MFKKDGQPQGKDGQPQGNDGQPQGVAPTRLDSIDKICYYSQ